MTKQWVRKAGATWGVAPGVVLLLACGGGAAREARDVADAPALRRLTEPDRAAGRPARGATAAPGPEGGRAPAAVAPGRAPETSAEGALTREGLVGAVLARSPALRERAHRVRARAAEARAAGALPPAMAMATLWQAPLRSPYVYGDGSMLMLGLQQTFPPAGALESEARALLEGARAEAAALAGAERELVRRAERALADYAGASRMERVHVEHGALVAAMRDAARARLSTGGTTLADLARAELEAARLEGEMALTEGERGRAVAELNALLGRPADAPLGPPADEPATAPGAALERVRELARRHRPELDAARAASRGEGARGAAARARATWPEVTLGINYGLQRPSGASDTWGATAAVSLPWLSPGSAARREAAESARLGAAAAESAAALDVEREVGDAYARARAAAWQLRALDARVVPASEGAVAAARAAYVGGPGDALAWLEALRVRLEASRARVEARAELDRALADLDRAAGVLVPRAPLAAPEGAPHAG